MQKAKKQICVITYVYIIDPLVKGLKFPLKRTQNWDAKYDVGSTINKGENANVDRNFVYV